MLKSTPPIFQPDPPNFPIQALPILLIAGRARLLSWLRYRHRLDVQPASRTPRTRRPFSLFPRGARRST
eukprot:6214100-Pleurochrysis_carterae.AAC.2